MATNVLSPILQVAKDIISESKTPSKGLHVNEIAKIAVSKNQSMGHDEETLAKKLSSALSANLKTKKPRFTKPTNKNGGARKGVYGVKKSLTSPSPITIKLPLPDPVNVLYAGKAGEYAVASELLFWGFNISMMAVDQGVDLVAEKAGKFFHIQVKTCSVSQKDNVFGFQVKPKAFSATINLVPWYVFVMREGRSIDYAVIPHSLILHLNSTGIISSKSMSFQIIRDEKKRFYKLNGHEIKQTEEHKMKKILFLMLSLAVAFPVFARGYSVSSYKSPSRSYSSRSVKSYGSNTHVRGYTTKNGTYVQPHIRTNPNSTKMDNYSTKGNVNPYTGENGTANPYSLR